MKYMGDNMGHMGEDTRHIGEDTEHRENTEHKGEDVEHVLSIRTCRRKCGAWDEDTEHGAEVRGESPSLAGVGWMLQEAPVQTCVLISTQHVQHSPLLFWSAGASWEAERGAESEHGHREGTSLRDIEREAAGMLWR